MKRKRQKKRGGETEKIQISDLERELFLVILQQKFLTIELIEKWLGGLGEVGFAEGKRSKWYYRLYRMVEAGYLRTVRIDGKSLYLLAQRGLEEIAELNRYKLPLVPASDLVTVAHDLLCAEFRLYVESLGASQWISDREIRLHLQKVPHVPDGGFVLRERVIYLEVELTQKTKERYDAIHQLYMRFKGAEQVVYLYREPAVVRYLQERVGDHPRFGFFPFHEVVSAPKVQAGATRRSTLLSTFLQPQTQGGPNGISR